MMSAKVHEIYAQLRGLITRERAAVAHRSPHARFAHPEHLRSAKGHSNNLKRRRRSPQPNG